jgi:hypothetical protein
VTIIASDTNYSGKQLTIKDPQVVNGLQTSHEIFQILAKGVGTEDERNVLVRVIVPRTPASYERIVRATNSQTTMPSASLRATDPIHRNIEDYLRSHELYYERRKNYYKNEGRPRDKIVSIPYLSQAVMAIVLGQPNDARARPSTLIKNDHEYKRVFDPKLPIEIFPMCVKVVKRVELALKEAGLTSADVNNLRFYVAFFAVRRSLKSKTPSKEKLKALKWDRVTDASLEKSRLAVWEEYQKLGGDDKAAKGRPLLERLNARL